MTHKIIQVALRNKKWLLSLISVSYVFFASVVVVFAQEPAPGTEAAQNFVAKLNEVILLPLIALMMGVALLVFLFGCFEYIRGANNSTAREQGAKHITYGIIGLVVMISAWAILQLAAGTFGLQDRLGEVSVGTSESALV